MEIKTKYNIGDKVWSIHDGKAVEFIIDEIAITINKYWPLNIIYETYCLEEFRQCFSEEKVFPTKEELLKSL